MIRCNLSVLLAERNLKITNVSRDTGISRTTLTALANNSGHGIQFETFNTLCTYLNVKPSQLFNFIPFDIECTNIEFNNISSNSKNCFITLQITDNSEVFKTHLVSCLELNQYKNNGIAYINIDLALQTANGDINLEKENALTIKYLKMLPIQFRYDLQDEIIVKIYSKLPDPDNTTICIKNSILFSETYEE